MSETWYRKYTQYNASVSRNRKTYDVIVCLGIGKHTLSCGELDKQLDKQCHDSETNNRKTYDSVIV